MPIYEYECRSCRSVEEVLQRLSDPPVATCSRCSGPMHKLISRSSFHLKGDGWYVTDYAKRSKPGDASENAASDAAAASPEKTASADATARSDE